MLAWPVSTYAAPMVPPAHLHGGRVRRLPSVVTILVTLTAASGCGGSGDGANDARSDEAAIREVAADFVVAANARDWKTVCSLFTPDAVRQAESLGVSCEESFERRNPTTEKVTRFTVSNVQVRGDRATAILEGENTVEGLTSTTQAFEKVDGEWKMGLAGSGDPSP